MKGSKNKHWTDQPLVCRRICLCMSRVSQRSVVLPSSQDTHDLLFPYCGTIERVNVVTDWVWYGGSVAMGMRTGTATLDCGKAQMQGKRPMLKRIRGLG
jgi:hypothetical protein